MLLKLKSNLPFISVTAAYQGKTVEITDVLVDTGAASTILSADIVDVLEITPLPEDILHIIRGVGGSEFVFSRCIDYLQAGNRRLTDFEVEVGGMDYGFEMNGILGMDFLSQTGAIVNLRDMKIEFGK